MAASIDHWGTDNPLPSSGTVTETIVTSQPNSIIFFYSVPYLPLVNFVSNPPLTWRNPPWTISGDGAGFSITNCFYAVAPNAGTYIMTGTYSAPIGRFIKVFWFDVVGADVASIFDGNLFTDPCCPQGNPNTTPNVSTAYTEDLLIAYEIQTSGSLPTNIPTFNQPFNQIMYNINGGYSIAFAWAYYQTSAKVTSTTYTPVTWQISSITRGMIFAIKSAPGSPPPTPTNITVTARPH